MAIWLNHKQLGLRAGLPGLFSATVLVGSLLGCSPTHTPTPTPVSESCTNPVWTSSAPFGQWFTNGFYVNNNKWNTSEAGPQTIYVCGYNSWKVVSNQPELASNPGSIKTYPDTQKNFNQAISSFNTITSSFAESALAVGAWNAAYDIWINGIAASTSTEVMIWNDYPYLGQIPPSGTEARTAIIDGQTYDAWRKSNGRAGWFIVFAMRPIRTSGTVNILNLFNWLATQGWLSTRAKLSAIEYGFEIASTDGGPATFAVNHYSLTTT